MLTKNEYVLLVFSVNKGYSVYITLLHVFNTNVNKNSTIFLIRNILVLDFALLRHLRNSKDTCIRYNRIKWTLLSSIFMCNFLIPRESSLSLTGDCL